MLHLRHERRIGVEHAVHLADVPGAVVRPQKARVAVIAVAAAEALVVADVASRLLEVRHQPSPLEHFGQEVGGLLAREVHAAQLGHAVVAVLEEHSVVELFGPPQTYRGVDGLVARDVEVTHEFLEEQAPQRQRRARITGEQGPLHHLGQVYQRENRLVEVGEIAPEYVGLLGHELLGDIDGHGG